MPIWCGGTSLDIHEGQDDSVKVISLTGCAWILFILGNWNHLYARDH